MQEIQYIGEHLLPGKLGHLAVVLGFVASLLAFVAYFFATQRRSRPEYGHWRTMGRSAFWLHSLSVLTIIGVLFYVMVNKYYEYQYVFAHVNEDLPFQYIFSAFWEGQEGSFLLWMFWHVVLGLVLIARAGKWEAPVMSMVSLVQLFIGSMILGLYFGFGEELTKIGSNPVLLLRDTMDAPIFSNADYLSLIKGSGL
ncbi:MAG: cytochrome c assembly protein, partial [Saprospiraceae bacterium]|nr:cytochrome c assembly protein [Saprospiraceae bacterium]